MSSPSSDLKPVVNKIGQLLIVDSPELILCKPRLMPLKSLTLEKLETMQESARNEIKASSKTSDKQ